MKKMPFIKKIFVQFFYKEKYGSVPKLKLIKKKHNQKFKKHIYLFWNFRISIALLLWK